jgi:hypothetical protein
MALGNTPVHTAGPAFDSTFQEAQNTETVSVFGRGSGLTVESAREDALRDVVEKAVGLLVDATTILENDKLIESVLTYSGAYVESYKVTSTVHEESGLVRIKIFAEVRKTKLHKRLSEAKLIKAKVDGSSLFAKVQSKRNEEASAADIVHRAFEGFPLNVMKASVDGEPKIIDTGDTIKMTVNVLVQVDEQAWITWKDQADQLLEPLARKSGRGVMIKEEPMGYDIPAWREIGILDPNYSPVDGFRHSSALRIRVKPGPNQETSWYFFEGEKIEHELALPSNRMTDLQVSLLSAEGDVIATKIVGHDTGRMKTIHAGHGGGRGRLWVSLTPFKTPNDRCSIQNGAGNTESTFALNAGFWVLDGWNKPAATTSVVVPVDFDLPMSSLASVSELSVMIKERPLSGKQVLCSRDHSQVIYCADLEKSHHPVPTESGHE